MNRMTIKIKAIFEICEDLKKYIFIKLKHLVSAYAFQSIRTFHPSETILS